MTLLLPVDIAVIRSFGDPWIALNRQSCVLSKKK